MGKISTTNLRHDTVNEINQEVFWEELYVDPMLGNDANDGLTKDRPIKTLKRLSDMLSYKTLSADSLTISLAEGTYTDTIMLKRMNGHSTLRISGAGPDKTFISPIFSPTSEEFTVFSLVKSQPYVSLSHLTISPVSENDLIYGAFLDTNEVCIIHDTVNLDFSNVKNVHGAVYVNKTSVESSTVNIVGGTATHAVIAGADSLVVTNVYSKNPTICSAEVGGRLFVGNMGEKGIQYTKKIGGIIINEIDNGIIVESGENENGYYVKYGDGTLICTNTISIDIVEVNKHINVIWNFPMTFIHHDKIGFVNLFASRKVATSSHTSDYTLDIVYTSYSANAAAAITLKDDAIQTSSIAVLAVGRWK